MWRAILAGRKVGNVDVIDERVKGFSDICKMSHCDRKMISTRPGDGEVNLGDVERKKVDLGLDNALDQSFFWLYDLNLKCGLDTSKQNNIFVHRNTNLGYYQMKEQCTNVFKYHLPYANASSMSSVDVQSLSYLVISASNPSIYSIMERTKMVSFLNNIFPYASIPYVDSRVSKT